MLPTKGYFQDIECPFYNTNCGRPYCHYRHRKRPNESVDDGIQESTKNVVPTYKPTPKSELENIHNSRSHIPISYVPDLAFKRDRTVRPVRIQTATYKPTPLSILSSAAKPESSLSEKNLYNPLESDINFEELTNEFDLIDNIIHDTEKVPGALTKIEVNTEKEQDEPNLQLKVSKIVDDTEEPRFSSDEEKEDVCTSKPTERKPSPINKLESEIKTEKPDSTTSCLPEQGTKNDKGDCEKSSRKIKSKKEDDKSSSKKSKSKKSSRDSDSKSSSRSHKSSKRESHRKEEKKGSSKDKQSSSSSRHKHKSKSPKPEKHHRHRSSRGSSSGLSSRDSTPDKSTKDNSKSSIKNKKESSSRSKSSSSTHEKKRKRSRSPSVSKGREENGKINKDDKEKSKNKNRSKDKLVDENKDKLRKHEKRHSKKSDTDKRKRTSESNMSTSGHDNDQDDIQDTSELDPEMSDIDLNFEDEDETMRECYKIFNEYKPEPIKPQMKVEECPKTELDDDDIAYQGKKRKAHAGAENIATHSKYVPSIAPPKPVLLPGQMLANRYKIAKMAQANQEQDQIINEVKSMTEKKPSSLLEAARLHKLKRLQQQKSAQQCKPSRNVVDDILNGIHKPSSSSQTKVVPKKIAAVPNVALIEKAKERISLVKSRNMQNCKTVAQTQKGGRVAHIPEYSLSDIPDVLQADKSKLPVNVRTRFLTMIAEECSKLYALKEDAFNRALNEEFACYEKCKVLATYRNSAMLAVNRLRKEIQERESKGLGPLLNGESSVTKKESDFEGKTFYENVKKWVLTDEELDIHGYPKESGTRGKAIINNRIEISHTQLDDNYRKCCRCGKLHQVDDDGWPLFEEECMYHPLKKRTLRGEQIYLCCKSNDDTGCATSDTHVFDGTESHLLEGFQTTLPPESDSDPRSRQVYALDCEMCYTTRGLELTRVTIIDIACKTVYESLVKPLNPIMDYNTRFSGITKEQMDRTSTSILQVQANILHLCNSETILVGHSLESDMKALKIVHGNVIDTAVLFPHKMGLPHKRALRALASEYLKKIIQNDVSGHDSAEDAVTCMELIKWKLKEDLKVKTK